MDDLHAIRNDDEAATDVMRSIRSSCRTLGDLCLPRVNDILGSQAMTSYRRADLGGDEVDWAAMYRTAHDRGLGGHDRPPPDVQPGSPRCAQLRSGVG